MRGFIVAIPATCVLAAVACVVAADVLQQHSSFILLALVPSLFQGVVVVRRMIEASRIQRVLARWREPQVRELA